MGGTEPDVTSPSWLQSKIGALRGGGGRGGVVSASFESMAAAGGLSADMQRIRVCVSDGGEETFVLKRTFEERTEMSQTMGLVREAEFYKFVAAQPPDSALARIPLPRVLFAEGDMHTGRKLLIMEDLSHHAQLGYFFGGGSPHNWGKDLPALCAPCPGLGVPGGTALAFGAAAQLHAPFWNDAASLSASPATRGWLRGGAWRAGEGEGEWRAYQRRAADAWEAAKGRMGGEGGVRWDPKVVGCVEASVATGAAEGAWGAFQAEMRALPLTLVHGDFHPANLMVSGEPPRLVMLDFEQVGVGSGPQDLAQFMISHAAPSDRRAEERGAVRGYHAALCALAPAATAAWGYTEEEAFEEYVRGGVGRWAWFLPVLEGMLPAKVTQYFHDQFRAFVEDHGVTPETMPMPRV